MPVQMPRRSVLLQLGWLATAPAWADDALWAVLRRGGQVVLVRHASTTPGVGDPPGMQLADCASQRNLSDAGRAEARRLGAVLRERKVPVGVVLSSPWCRCLDTARLALQRDAKVEPALANLFGRPEQQPPQVTALRQAIARLPLSSPGAGNAFLFTHGSTVLALTGVSPAQAEMVVLTPQADGGLVVAGRIAAP